MADDHEITPMLQDLRGLDSRAAAQRYAVDAVAVLDSYYDKDSWMASRAQAHIGHVLLGLRLFDEAENLLVQAHDGFERQFGASNLRADACRETLVDLYLTLNRPEDARPYAEAGVELASRIDESSDERPSPAP